jgi:hypothetical protein
MATNADPNLPSDIAEFLRDHIPSLHQLEIVLYLYQHARAAWTAAALAQRLYLPFELVAERLTDLEQRGIIQRCSDGAAPDYQAILTHATLVERLALLYQERRVRVISFIFSQPNETVRSFAEAFKVRKDKER